MAAANCLRWGHFALIRKSIYDSAQKTPEQSQASTRPGSMCAHIYAIVFVTVCLCVCARECAGICCQITLFANVCCLLIIRFTPVFIVRQRDERATLHTHTHTYMGAALCACVWRRQRVVCLYALYLSLCLCVCVVEFVYFLLTFFTRACVCVCWGLFARLDCRFKDSTANSSAAPAVCLSYSTLPVCVCVWVVCVTLPLGGNERSLVVNPT